MRRTYIIGMIVVLLGALILSGCGQSGVSENEEQGGAERIRLKIMHNWTGQDGKAIAMRAIMDEFRAANPHVELEDEGLPTDVLKVRLRTVAAADEMPDLFVMWPEAMTKDFVHGGLIQPINDYLDSKPAWRDAFLPGSFDSFTVEGRIYTVPMSLAPTSVIYYNKALFDRYGAKVPETWEELNTAVQTFNANGIIPISLGNKSNWVVQSTIFSTLSDRITGTAWFYDAVNQNGEARFTDKTFVEAVKLLQDFVKTGAFQPNFNLIDDNQMMQIYFDGRAAMFINGAWAMSNVVQNAPESVLNNTHLAILPPIKGGRGKPNSVSGVVGAGLGISNKLTGERKAAALDLFYALAGPDGQKATIDSSTLVSYNLEPDTDKAHPLFVELFELMQHVEITPVYDVSLSLPAVEVINSGLQDVMLGGNPYRLAQQLQDVHAAAVRK